MTRVLIVLILAFVAGHRGSAAADQSLALDGVDDYAIAAASLSLDLGVGAGKRLTLEAFFVVSGTNSLGYASLISKTNAYELGIEFAVNSQVFTHFILWKTPNPAGRVETVFNTPLVPGRHHLAATLGNSTNNNALAIFLDGLPVILYTSISFPSGIAASGAPLTIGGGPSNHFRGWLDEVRLSSMVRYTNDGPVGAYAPYRVPATPLTADAATAALWHFDEASGASVFYDSSTNGDHLAAVNGVTTVPTPVIQTAGTLDQTFLPGFGVWSDISPGGVYALGLQTNNQIVIGGQFSRADGLARTNLARFNPDGSVDPAFNVGFAPGSGMMDVTTLLALPNNQLFIGGHFATVNGVGRIGLARLNQDGSTDTNFPPVLANSSQYISAMTRQPDGKLIISGNFTFFNSSDGTYRYGAARLNPNGTLDPSFDASSLGNRLYNLPQVILQPDGKLLCPVSILNFSASLYTNVIRLNTNGSLDVSFQPVITDSGFSESIGLQSDGKVLLAGYFATVNGAARAGAARFLTNGVLDPSFNLANSTGTYYANGGQLDFAAIQSDGKILLGGGFNLGPSGSGMGLARFLPNGAFDSSFQPAQFPNPVHGLEFTSSNRMLIAGDFTAVNGYSRGGIARLYGDPIIPPRFLSFAALPGGVVRLDVTNPATLPIVLQSTTNLVSPAWQSILTNAQTTNKLRLFYTNDTTPKALFYRALQLGP